MPDLPLGDRAFYAGIDPGFTGALALINAAGTSVRVWDMPTTGKGKQREIDLDGLWRVFGTFKKFPDCVLGIEWPTTRPGEGAERSERFGRGKGVLEAFAFARRLPYHKIAPNLWKGRLGLPGKEDREANRKGYELLLRYYPDQAPSLLRGPQGGYLSGRIDAVAIAHFLRVQSVSAMRTIAEQFGKDSPEAYALILGGGGRRKSTMRT